MPSDIEIFKTVLDRDQLRIGIAVVILLFLISYWNHRLFITIAHVSIIILSLMTLYYMTITKRSEKHI